MLPSARMTARQAAAREIVHPELGSAGRLFTPLPGAFTSTPSPLVNLCANGSFEHDTLGAAVAGWTKNSGSTSMTAHGTLPTGAIGTHAANFGSGSSEIWQYQQTVASPVTAGVAYTVSALFIQNASNATGFRLQIQWLNASNAVISTTSGSFTGNPGNGSSGTVSAAGTAPGGAVTARILLDHNVADINACNIDAINFAPTAQGTTYHDGDTAAWVWSGTAGNSSSGGQPTNPQPTGVSKYGQAGWAYDITEAFFDNGVQTQDWDLARVLRNSGLFAESDGAAPPVHVFSPADVPGLLGWWDFSTLAGNDGDAIASINDLSGNGRTFSQATGANQPLLRKTVNGINGLSVVQFDGVNDFMTTPAFASPTAGVTVLAVIKWTTAASAYKEVLTHVVAVGTWNPPYARWDLRESGASGKWQVFVEDGSVVPGNYAEAVAALTTNAEVHGLRYDQATINHYKDGVVDGTNTKTGPLTSSNQPLYLGSNPTPNEFADVKVGEILYYDNGVSNANLALLSTYFRGRWGTA